MRSRAVGKLEVGRKRSRVQASRVKHFATGTALTCSEKRARSDLACMDVEAGHASVETKPSLWKPCHRCTIPVEIVGNLGDNHHECPQIAIPVKFTV